MPKSSNTHDKHSQKEVLRSLGSGSHLIRDALRGHRGTPQPKPPTPTPPPRTTPRQSRHSAPPAAPRHSAPAAAASPPQRHDACARRRWPRQPADDFIVQGGSKGFRCAPCGKSYVSMQYAREHVHNRHHDLLPPPAQSESGQKSFKCAKCDYVGSSQHGLRIHMGSKHKR